MSRDRKYMIFLAAAVTAVIGVVWLVVRAT
jgi:hypothetical protein